MIIYFLITQMFWDDVEFKIQNRKIELLKTKIQKHTKNQNTERRKPILTKKIGGKCTYIIPYLTNNDHRRKMNQIQLCSSFNSNTCRFQWLENILSITFAVQYFNQKKPNGAPINHFLPRNIQDNIKTSDGKFFFVKFYSHERPEHVQSNLIHHSIKKCKFEKKNIKRHPK